MNNSNSPTCYGAIPAQRPIGQQDNRKLGEIVEYTNEITYWTRRTQEISAYYLPVLTEIQRSSLQDLVIQLNNVKELLLTGDDQIATNQIVPALPSRPAPTIPLPLTRSPGSLTSSPDEPLLTGSPTGSDRHHSGRSAGEIPSAPPRKLSKSGRTTSLGSTIRSNSAREDSVRSNRSSRKEKSSSGSKEFFQEAKRISSTTTSSSGTATPVDKGQDDPQVKLGLALISAMKYLGGEEPSSNMSKRKSLPDQLPEEFRSDLARMKELAKEQNEMIKKFERLNTNS